MRIKLKVVYAQSASPDHLVLSLPAKINTFQELQPFLLGKLSLPGKVLKFKLENFAISPSDNISEILLNPNADVLTVEVLDSKKRAAEHFLEDAIQKKCDFCDFIDKCSQIKGVFNERSVGRFRGAEENQVQENQVLEKEEQAEKSEEIATKPVIKSEKPQILKKSINKIVRKETSSDSSSSDSDENANEGRNKNLQKPLVQKKAADIPIKLNILTPEEEFQRKKAQWNSKQNQPKTQHPPKGSPKPSPKYLAPNSQEKPPQIPEKPMTNLNNPPKIQNYQPKPPKWIPIPKDLLLKSNETPLQSPLLAINDIISFKMYVLSEEALCPVLSEFKAARILRMDPENPDIFTVSNGSGNEVEVKKSELLELKIEISGIDENRAKVIIGGYEETKIKEKTNEKPRTQNKNPGKEYSKEDYIARQVNYYFSDKNYPKDEFIQAHVKKSEEKYFPLRLLLNFPKIKQVTQDVDWLISALSSFRTANEETCNFEFGSEPGTVRKKINP